MKQSLSGWQGRSTSPSYWVSVWFGAGLLRPAPGTWGSLVAAIMGFAAFWLGLPFVWALVAVFSVTLLGIVVINDVQSKSAVHDAPEIVVDEVAGQWLAMLPLFYAPMAPDTALQTSLLAFILFRVFDIWKPWPIGWVDKKMDGGLGVMFDDLIAGLIALVGIEICLTLIQ